MVTTRRQNRMVEDEDVAAMAVESELEAETQPLPESKSEPEPDSGPGELAEAQDGISDEEEEFHTEASGSSEDEIDGDRDRIEDNDLGHGGVEDVNDRAGSQSKTPLLPAHILQPLPSPLPSDQAVEVRRIDLSKLSRKERRAVRDSDRRAKKRKVVGRQARREKERMKAVPSMVIEAGKAAQIKRGVITNGNGRVQSGRISKPQGRAQPPPKPSGRQRLLEKRVKDIRAKTTVNGIVQSQARDG